MPATTIIDTTDTAQFPSWKLRIDARMQVAFSYLTGNAEDPESYKSFIETLVHHEKPKVKSRQNPTPEESIDITKRIAECREFFDKKLPSFREAVEKRLAKLGISPLAPMQLIALDIDLIEDVKVFNNTQGAVRWSIPATWGYYHKQFGVRTTAPLVP